MGQFSQSGKFAHDTACNKAEATRQSTAATVAQSPAGQAALNAAEIVWARACIASCDTNNNGIGKEPFINVLRSLGVNS
jgi:hypothetical protein